MNKGEIHDGRGMGKRAEAIGTGIAELDNYLEGGFLSNTVGVVAVKGEGLRLETSH